MVKDAADAALYTGRAPSAESAYLNGGDIYGLSFPTDGMAITRPTAADAGGWPHFLEGGNTAVRLGDGPNAGYLVNPTREFCIDPAVSAQVRLLKHKPQRGFSCPALGEGDLPPSTMPIKRMKSWAARLTDFLCGGVGSGMASMLAIPLGE
jgi:hypothetical protein